jgi:hypothetical protein
MSYAWCFDHGRLHNFGEDGPWCTAWWVPLPGESTAEALLIKEAVYGNAVFYNELPLFKQVQLANQERIMTQSIVGSDYEPGDFPVPVGAHVRYHGRSAPHGLYEVTARRLPPEDRPDPEVNYPDGVSYDLWPVGLPQKFALRDRSVAFVRRTSFIVVPDPDEE